MLHLASTLVLLLIAAGIYYRKTTHVHLKLMWAAFIIDVLLVISIEVTRHEVEVIAHHARPLLWFHVALSILVLAAYVKQIQLGRAILAGFPASRQLHLTTGMTFCTLRLLNYVTSFMIV